MAMPATTIFSGTPASMRARTPPAAGEGREVVVAHDPLLRSLARAVEPLGVLEGPQRDRGQGLGLAAGEHGRTVGPGQEADLARDRADVVEAAPVGPELLLEDALADEVTFCLIEE